MRCKNNLVFKVYKVFTWITVFCCLASFSCWSSAVSHAEPRSCRHRSDAESSSFTWKQSEESFHQRPAMWACPLPGRPRYEQKTLKKSPTLVCSFILDDWSRVKLAVSNPNETSDYINASYMPVGIPNKVVFYVCFISQTVPLVFGNLPGLVFWIFWSACEYFIVVYELWACWSLYIELVLDFASWLWTLECNPHPDHTASVIQAYSA